MLPDKEHFVDDPDWIFTQERAYELFGGLSLEHAFVEFSKNPNIACEYFSLMGHKAFLYYFPIIERYVESKKDTDFKTEDEFISIIGRAISSQIYFNPSLVKLLKDRIMALIPTVEKITRSSGLSVSEKAYIRKKWNFLKKMLS